MLVHCVVIRVGEQPGQVVHLGEQPFMELVQNLYDENDVRVPPGTP